jgi:competence protein ComEC
VGVAPSLFLRRFSPPEWSAARPRDWPSSALAWLGRSWTADADRRALWLPVGLGSGIAFYFALAGEPPSWICPATLLAGLVIAWGALWQRQRPFLRALLALVAAALIGFSAAKFRTDRMAAPVLTHRIGPVHFDARVISADAHGKGTRLLLETARIGRLGASRTPARVRISVRMQPNEVSPGEWVNALAVLMPPPAPATPGGYDFGRWAYYQQIGAVGYAYGKPKPISAPRAASLFESWSAAVERLRSSMTARVRDVIPGQNGAIAAALITGEEGAIDENTQTAFRNSGLSHVLSISGLHLALAGGMFFWVLRALLAAFPIIALNYPIKKWAAVAALAGAAFYLVISGADSPAVRSYIMLAMMFAGILFDRPALSMRSVAFAAAIILLWQPEALIAPGFEMSFAAVTGLIAFAEWEQARRAKRVDTGIAPGIVGKIRSYISGILAASLVATIASSPFAIFHFDRAPQYGLLANLLALPVASFVIMPAATAAMVLMPLSLDRLPLIVMGKGVGVMLAIAEWVASLPGASAMLPFWPMATLALVTFGGLWIALWRGVWRWLGLAPVAAGLSLALLAVPPDILIARDGGDVAVRLANGNLTLLHAPKDDYAAETWLKRDGDSRLPAQAIGVVKNGIRCDSDGCTARLPSGLLLAQSSRIDALRNDCEEAAIVVSAVPTRHRCKGPKLVIDRFDVAKNGAYAIRFGSPMTIETVNETRGERPWSEHPARMWRNKSSHRPFHGRATTGAAQSALNTDG